MKLEFLYKDRSEKVLIIDELVLEVSSVHHKKFVLVRVVNQQ